MVNIKFSWCVFLAPSGFDQIVLLERGSRHVRISWDPPAMSNGLLVNYTVSVGGEDMAATPPNVLDYNVTELLPFTAYNFSVMACTSAGCVESSTLTVTTREDSKTGRLTALAIYFVSNKRLLSLSHSSRGYRCSVCLCHQ